MKEEADDQKFWNPGDGSGLKLFDDIGNIFIFKMFSSKWAHTFCVTSPYKNRVSGVNV